MRFPILAALSAILLTGCGSPEEGPPRERIENAWVRLPAVDGRPAAAYFDLYGGEDGAVLIAMNSERVETIALHETVERDGVMRMEPLGTVEAQLGQTVHFEPGGRHAMLFGLDPEITPGTRLPLSFRFDNGRDVRVEAVTIGAGDEAPFGEEG